MTTSDTLILIIPKLPREAFKSKSSYLSPVARTPDWPPSDWDSDWGRREVRESFSAATELLKAEVQQQLQGQRFSYEPIDAEVHTEGGYVVHAASIMSLVNKVRIVLRLYA